MPFSEEALEALLTTPTLDLQAVLALRATRKSFRVVITSRFPNVLVALSPREGRLLVGSATDCW